MRYNNAEDGFELIEHPQYSPNLPPSDYRLFPELKEHWGNKYQLENCTFWKNRRDADLWRTEAEGEHFSDFWHKTWRIDKAKSAGSPQFRYLFSNFFT